MNNKSPLDLQLQDGERWTTPDWIDTIFNPEIDSLDNLCRV